MPVETLQAAANVRDVNAPYKRSDNQRTRVRGTTEKATKRKVDKSRRTERFRARAGGGRDGRRRNRRWKEREKERESGGRPQDDNISRSLFLEHVITLPRKASREGTRLGRHMASDVCMREPRGSLVSAVSIPDSCDKREIDTQLKLDGVPDWSHVNISGVLCRAAR